MPDPIPPQAPPAAPPALAPGPPQAELTAREAETMAGWIREDVAKGKLTPEQAAKAFDALNASPEQRAPDSRSDEEKILDKQFPPAKPADYTIRYGGPGEDVPMTPELKQFDTTARAWMSGAGLPRELGNSLVNAIAKTVQQTHKMTPAQLDAYIEAENAKLDRCYGPALEEKLRSAAVMIHALDAKTPG